MTFTCSIQQKHYGKKKEEERGWREHNTQRGDADLGAHINPSTIFILRVQTTPSSGLAFKPFFQTSMITEILLFSSFFLNIIICSLGDFVGK